MPRNEVKVKVTADTAQAEAAVGGLGSKMGGILKAGAIAAGIAVIGLGAASLSMGANFQTAFAEVTTLFDAPAAAIDSLRDGVRNLSRDMGIDATEAAGALYTAISKGVPPDNAIAFLRENVKLAIAGVTDLQTAVDLTSGAIKAFGLTGNDLQRVSDALFTTVQLGGTTLPELAAAMFNVAPAAGAAGLSIEQIGASLAVLTANMIPTNVATTSLRQGIAELGKAGTVADKNFRDVAGIGFRDFISAGGDMAGAMELLKQKADADGVAVSDLFGSIEAGLSIQVLAVEGFEDLNAALATMDVNAGTTQTAYEKMNETFARQFALLKENLKFAMLEIGLAVMPIMIRGVQFLSGAFDDASAVFGAFADELKRNKPLAIGLAFAVGTLLAGAMGVATVAVLGFVGAMLLAAAPVIAVAAAIGLLGAGMVLLVQRGPEIEAFFTQWGRGMAEGAGIVRDIIVNVVDFIGGIGQTMFDAGVSWMTAMARGIAGAGARVLAAVADMVASVIIRLNPLMWVFGSTMQDVYERAGKESGEAMVSALERAISRVAGVTGPLLEPLKEVRDFIGGLQSELGRLLGLGTVEGTDEQLRLAELKLDLIQKEGSAEQELERIQRDRLERLAPLEERLAEARSSEQNATGFIKFLERQIQAINDEETAIERDIRVLKEQIETITQATEVRRLETEVLRLRGVAADATLLTDSELVKAAEALILVIGQETEAFGLSAEMINATYLPTIQSAAEATDILGGGVGELQGVLDDFNVDDFTIALDEGKATAGEMMDQLIAMGVDVVGLGITIDELAEGTKLSTIEQKGDWDKLKESLALYVDSSRAGFKKALQFFVDWSQGTIQGLQTVGGWFDWLGGRIKAAFDGLTDFLGLDLTPDMSIPGFLDPRNIPGIPDFHQGGVVPGIPGTERLIVAQAGEVVQTADEAQFDDDRGAGSGGGIVIHELHLHGPLREALADLGLEVR